MTTCKHPDCGYPQGECAGLCMHRVNTDFVDQVRFVPEEVEQRRRIHIDMPIEPPGRLRFAWNVYRIYRGANRSRKTALHQAWKAFRQPN